MKPALVIIAIAVTAVGSAMAAAQEKQPEAVEIPLKEIWAYQMPGTCDVRELEPDHFGERTRSLPSEERFRLLGESLAEQIRQTLKYPEPRGANAKKGFAVLGTASEALDNAHRVLVEKQKPQESFSEGSDVSIVFFSYLAGKYVHVKKVELQHDTVTIRYEFVSHKTKNVSSHFSIIPLGKLAVGKYRVEMVQLPIAGQSATEGNEYVAKERSRQIVCQPFSFSVVGR